MDLTDFPFFATPVGSQCLGDHCARRALAVGARDRNYLPSAPLAEQVDLGRPGNLSVGDGPEKRRASLVDGRVDDDQFDIIKVTDAVSAEVAADRQIADFVERCLERVRGRTIGYTNVGSLPAEPSDNANAAPEAPQPDNQNPAIRQRAGIALGSGDSRWVDVSHRFHTARKTTLSGA